MTKPKKKPDARMAEVRPTLAWATVTVGGAITYVSKHRDVARGFAYTQGGERVVRVEVRAAKARAGK